MAFLQKPKPKANWYNIITPYELEVWVAIIITVFCSAFVLGICTKIRFMDKKFDWSIHLVDAFNPMVGRPMESPGFMINHIKERRTLSFELFLMTYALGCMIISAGYDSGLMSHLTTTVYPAPYETLDEYSQAEFKDILWLSDPESLINVFKSSPIKALNKLPDLHQIKGTEY